MHKDLLLRFESYLALSGRKPSTIRLRLYCLKRLFAKGVVPSRHSIDDFIVKNISKLSTSSINNYIDVLRLYVQFLKSSNLKYDPDLLTLKYLKDKYKSRSTMSIEEIEAFLNLKPITVKHTTNGKIKETISNPKQHDYWTMFFLIMAYTGMRTVEVAKLRVEDIDLGRNLFILEDTKTNENRLVPIPKNILSRLTEYIRYKTGYIFPAKNKNGYANSVSWGYNFHIRLKRLGIVRPNLTPYSLRHSYITEMLQTEGVNMFDVKNLVGHHDTRTTENYYHLTTKRLQRVSEKHPGIVKSDPQSVLIQINELLDKLELYRDNRFTVKKSVDSNALKFEIKISGTNLT